MIISTFNLETALLNQGYELIIGTDEAGRGPLAGPVVAAATMPRNFKFLISNSQTDPNDQISNDENWDLIRDSKTLSPKQREKVFDFIQDNFHVGVGICDNKTIDRMNILQASFLAMKKAIGDLIKNSEDFNKDAKTIILLDGNKMIPSFSSEQKAVVNGDRYVKSISAASIVAKVTRDRMMQEFHQKHPHYGFDRHKGYGTRRHLDSLSRFGPCEIHRQSFKPVEILVKKEK